MWGFRILTALLLLFLAGCKPEIVHITWSSTLGSGDYISDSSPVLFQTYPDMFLQPGMLCVVVDDISKVDTLSEISGSVKRSAGTNAELTFTELDGSECSSDQEDMDDDPRIPRCRCYNQFSNSSELRSIFVTYVPVSYGANEVSIRTQSTRGRFSTVNIPTLFYTDITEYSVKSNRKQIFYQSAPGSITTDETVAANDSGFAIPRGFVASSLRDPEFLDSLVARGFNGVIAKKITDSGFVAGELLRRTDRPVRDGFLFKDGRISRFRLPVRRLRSLEVLDVSESGLLVGTYSATDQGQSTGMRSGGYARYGRSFYDIGQTWLQQENSTAVAANRHLQIVGNVNNGDGAYLLSFYDRNAAPIILPALHENGSIWVTDINDHSMVLGMAEDASGMVRAVRWSNTSSGYSIRTLDSDGACFRNGDILSEKTIALNNAGAAIGVVTCSGLEGEHVQVPLLWTPDSVRMDIRLDIVDRSENDDDSSECEGGDDDEGDECTPCQQPSGWHIEQLIDLNDDFDILAQGTHYSGEVCGTAGSQLLILDVTGWARYD